MSKAHDRTRVAGATTSLETQTEHIQQDSHRVGRYLEDFTVGDVLRCRFGRTVTEADNLFFTCLTHNTNQVHFNAEFAGGTRFERILVNSLFTLSLVHGMSVQDTSENAVANLGWQRIDLPNPVFIGDTLYVSSEVLKVRDSRSDPTVGIVTVRTTGTNQDGNVVISFERAFMCPRRSRGTKESTA
jgi:acyl dehydratase